jgi:hypothetical protein
MLQFPGIIPVLKPIAHFHVTQMEMWVERTVAQMEASSVGVKIHRSFRRCQPTSGLCFTSRPVVTWKRDKKAVYALSCSFFQII